MPLLNALIKSHGMRRDALQRAAVGKLVGELPEREERYLLVQ
jgi:hypothetical protein